MVVACGIGVWDSVQGAGIIEAEIASQQLLVVNGCP